MNQSQVGPKLRTITDLSDTTPGWEMTVERKREGMTNIEQLVQNRGKHFDSVIRFATGSADRLARTTTANVH